MKNDEQLRKAKGKRIQRILFPMKYYAPYYGYGGLHTGQHKYSYAIDFIGKDSGKDEIYAPFDCVVTNVYAKKGHSYEVWLQSKDKVLPRNGELDYYTITYTHPTEIKDMKIGQEFKQGQLVCHEGKEGGATGNHLHFEIGRGKSNTWKIEKHGSTWYYMNQNKVKPEEYLFLPENSIREFEKDKIGSVYHMDKESEITWYISSKDGLYIHSTKDFKDSSKIALFDYNDDVILLRTEGVYALVYRMGILGWCAKKYLKKVK